MDQFKNQARNQRLLAEVQALINPAPEPLTVQELVSILDTPCSVVTDSDLDAQQVQVILGEGDSGLPVCVEITEAGRGQIVYAHQDAVALFNMRGFPEAARLIGIVNSGLATCEDGASAALASGEPGDGLEEVHAAYSRVSAGLVAKEDSVLVRAGIHCWLPYAGMWSLCSDLGTVLATMLLASSLFKVAFEEDDFGGYGLLAGSSR